ncbi:ASCH domain-containing protein [Lacticaseibacillus jixiensis]|uniref:ASCH domain-containing protein n=1 Tax=Lacticaseibacillus jixiensis TaxID=3231926 RepID=UPI0036F3B967
MIDEFFEQARQALVLAPDLTYARAQAIGDTPQAQDVHAQLVLAHQQTLQTSGFELYLSAHAPLPEARDVNVLLDGQGQPVALTYTEDVFIVPYASVNEAQAQQAGAASLDAWQQTQAAVFTKAYAQAGLTFDPATAMLVLEQFRVIYPID